MNSKLINVVPQVLLRSPLHRLLSSRYLVLEFTGRTTGRRYATPVAYVRAGDTILISTDSPWKRNLRGGAPVRVWLRGRPVDGEATTQVDPVESRATVRTLVDAIPSYARPAGLSRDGDGRVGDDEIARAVDAGRSGIVIVPGAR